MTTLDRPRRLDLAFRLLVETRVQHTASTVEEALTTGQIAETRLVDATGRGELGGDCVVAVLGDDGSIVEGPLAGGRPRFVVFDQGVLETVADGLALRRVVPGVSAREVQARFGVPMVADHSLGPIDPDTDAS